ncbi:hypothetical protein [Cryobacterium sp. GrIS_2_6]|nr:hypothetical protein [Cryobacterium psychrotolerans]MEC5149333.1 hypothetical protein [Cryobacterium psychrotolerans]
MSDTVIQFPKRLGLRSSSEQLDALKAMSMGELLAAWITKYPDSTFSADELLAAKGKRIRVQAIGRNEWTIVQTEHCAPTIPARPEGAESEQAR